MKLLRFISLASVASALLFSCKKDKAMEAERPVVSAETKARISELGFSTATVHKVDEGYLVEGDIVITDEMLKDGSDYSLMRVGSTEQYRTTNLVTGTPRTINVRVASSLPSKYVTATNAAIARFNAENLTIKFARVTSGGDIVLSASPWYYQFLGILGSGGFPTKAGKPHNSIMITYELLNSYTANAITTVIAHEIGHCIGFRHTDYKDRSYSCGGATENEGASDVGAILIPGTPAAADPNSWMLACTSSNINRPFNANDKIALAYVY
jgi:hypothetical protein